MSYKPEYDKVYEQLTRMIEARNQTLRCIRADKVLQPGNDLLGKVHKQILESSIVIADVTERSPNVYYEYGYANAHNRPPILIARRGRELPTDLTGKETLRYRGKPAADPEFCLKLQECIDQQLRSPLPEQWRMLASAKPFPAYLIAAPRVPGADSKHWWHPYERRTFGDMLGIAGILTAYGNLFGTRKLPDLLHAQCIRKDILTHPANIYCIGSPKVNPPTGRFLRLTQENLFPRWKMLETGRGKDRRVVIKGDPELDAILSIPISTEADGSNKDYGLIVRAPHPLDPQYMILIVAGRHSIGTHAACMVVTHQALIADLERRLDQMGISLREKAKPFWAIVRGTLKKGGEFSEDVEIIKVGGYRPG